MVKIKRYAILISVMVAFSSAQAAAAACGSINGSISHLKDWARLQAPTRLVVGPSDNLHVSDLRGNTVYIYDGKGNLKKSISIDSPRSVAVAPNGDIYVGSGTRVTVLNPDGSFKNELGGGFSLASDIAVSSDGRVFVLDSIQNRVRVFGPDGSQTAEIGYGTLNYPTGIAIDEGQGRLVIGDQKNYKIRIYNLSNYSQIYSFGAAQTDGSVTAGMFNFIEGVAVDAEGKIYVVDSGPDRIQIYDACYTFLGTISGFGSSSGSLRLPVDVAVDRYGRIFVASLGDGRVSVFRAMDVKNPVAVRPANNSLVLSQTPSLTVSNGYINALPLTYEFQVSSDSAFSNIIASTQTVAEGIGTTSWQTPVLTDNSTFYWRARATDDVSYTEWTQSLSFRVNEAKFSSRGEELVSENSPGIDGRPVLASDEESGKVWMAWHGNSEGNYHIYLRHFDTVMEAYSATSRVTSGLTDHINPAITVGKDGKVWLSWEEGGSISVSSYDPSSNSTPVAISTGIANSRNPVISASPSGEIVSLWDGEIAGERAIYLSRYDAGQNSWGTPEKVTVGLTDSGPSAAFDKEGRLWVSWKRTDPTGNNDIYVRYFDPVSSAWSAESVIANTSADENSVRLSAALDGYIWITYVSGGKIAARRYVSATSTWESETVLSNGPSDAHPSAIVDHSGKVWVVWDSNNDIYGKVFDGAWSEVAPLATDPSNDARPSLGLYFNNLWMAWESDRAGNLDVFAKSFFIDNLPSAPVLISPANGEVLKTQNPILTVSKAEDPDTSVLFYQFEIDTTNAFGSPSLIRSGLAQGTDSISWFPGTLEDGIYYWRARAFDGEGYGPWSAVGSFRVMTKNYPPTIDAYTPQESGPSVTYGGSVPFSITASDPNGDQLAYQWTVDGQAASDSSGYNFTPTAWKGLYSVSVTVSDGSLSASRSWTVNVKWNGTLTLSTDPAGARVYIDGNYGYPGVYLGETPLSVTGIAVGVHSLVFVKTGYETVYRQVRIEGASDISIPVMLSKAKKITPDTASPIILGDGTPLKVTGRAAPFVIDWNNDGFKDLLVGAGDGMVYLYMTEAQADGAYQLIPKGPLTSSEGLISVIYNAAPFVVDWNNDGRKDLLVGGGDGRVRLYLNVGFEDVPSLSSPGILTDGSVEIYVAGNAYPSVIDYNNDGRKDLAIGGSDGTIRLYLNGGTDWLPVFAAYSNITADDGEIRLTSDARPFFFDWNHDGKKDLISGGRLFLNVGRDDIPKHISITALPGWIKEKKRERGNREFIPYLGYTKEISDYSGQASPSTFVVDWDDVGGCDLVTGDDAGEVRFYHSAY